MVLVLSPHVVVACVQASRVCISCVPLNNYVKLLRPRPQVSDDLGHSSQNKFVVYLSLIDLSTVVVFCKIVYFSNLKNIFCLRVWSDIVHDELLCHKLGFINDFCANGSLWNNLIYTQ